SPLALHRKEHASNETLPGILILLLASATTPTVLACKACAMAQSAVTLWQFGRPRVAAGLVTLPYSLWEPPAMVQKHLYQVLSPTVIITTDQGGFATTTVPATVSRTIVASASGWVEHFGTTEAMRSHQLGIRAVSEHQYCQHYCQQRVTNPARLPDFDLDAGYVSFLDAGCVT
ncbi:hypothetical protein B0H13DRAFT_2413800, partial [Mycena leptocephala]